MITRRFTFATLALAAATLGAQQVPVDIGAALAVMAEGGHPVIYVNLKAISASGLSLPDNFFKLAKAAE